MSWEMVDCNDELTISLRFLLFIMLEEHVSAWLVLCLLLALGISTLSCFITEFNVEP